MRGRPTVWLLLVPLLTLAGSCRWDAPSAWRQGAACSTNGSTVCPPGQSCAAGTCLAPCGPGGTCQPDPYNVGATLSCGEQNFCYFTCNTMGGSCPPQMICDTVAGLCHAGSPSDDGGTWQPIVLASGQDHPSGIVVWSAAVYWTNAGTNLGTGAVMKIPVGGGSPTPLAAGQNAPAGIAVDGMSNVYWANSGSGSGDGSIMKVPLNGGTATAVASGQNSPGAIAYDSTSTDSVYWAAGDGIWRLQMPTGGTPVKLWSPSAGDQNPPAIAVDATSVYWLTRSTGAPNGNVMSLPLTGGTPVTLASGLNGDYAIAVDSTSVYWALGDTVMKVPLGGGGPVTLVSGTGNTPPHQALAVDAAHVYWTASKGITKVPLAGGSATLLAASLSGGYGLALDDTSVYWTDHDGGQVLKIAK